MKCFQTKTTRLIAALWSVVTLGTELQAYTALPDQVIKIGNGAEPRELDPQKATGTPESHILDNLFEGLTSLDPVTLAAIPGVAESWPTSTDGKVYTFKIRKDAKWSDGVAITAEDFVWSWKRALSPALASEYAYQLFNIVGAEAYNKGDLKDFSKVGVKAKSPLVLEVTLNNPTTYFAQLTAHHTLFPVPKHVVSKFKDDLEWTKPGNMVSNGPFMLSEWKLNQHVKVVLNPHYHDKDKVKLKEAWFLPIEDQDTDERTFNSGATQMTYEVPTLKIPLYKKEIEKNPKAYHAFRAEPYLGSYFYRVNVKKKPFDDLRVRRAFALAVDRTLLVEKITQAGELPGQTFTPTNIAGYTSPPVLNAKVGPAEIAEAKKLLAEAGYPEGKGFPKVEILYNKSDKHEKIALAVQQMLKKNLGVGSIELVKQEWKVYLNTQKKMDYQLSRSGWIGDYPDPNTFLDMFVTNGGQNNTGWSNANYDAAIKAAASAKTQGERFNHFLAAEKILMTELPIIPLYIYTNPKLVAQTVKSVTLDGKIIDYTPNIQDRRFLKYVVLAK